MARYRLNGPHYLNVPGTEWEQIEVDLQTGAQARKRYAVPKYLDPSDPKLCNYPGEVIVTDKLSPTWPKDILFSGPPTLDMTPLDEEAEAAVAKVQKMGAHPIESLPANGQIFSDTLLEKLTRQIDELASRGPARADDRVSALERQIEELKALIGAKAWAKGGISLGAS
jgi:hypothetical protein